MVVVLRFISRLISTLVKKLIVLLTCTAEIDGTHYLQLDPSVPCWQGPHLLWAWSAGLTGMLVYAIGLPFAGYRALRGTEDQLKWAVARALEVAPAAVEIVERPGRKEYGIRRLPRTTEVVETTLAHAHPVGHRARSELRGEPGARVSPAARR